MKQYVKLMRIFAANSIQIELEYRANLIMNIFNSFFAFATAWGILYVMFSQADSLGGWSFLEALSLVGVFMIFEAFIDIFMYPNLNKLPEYIRKGNMDFFLLKPISAQFMVSFRFASIWRIPELLLGFGILFYSMARLGQLNMGNLAITFLLLACAAAIVYSIWLMLTTSSFWLVKVENISELFSAFFMAGRFPISAFPLWIRMLLTVVVPIAFITTVPATAAIGKITWLTVVTSIAIALLLLAISHAFWRYAVANYTSASS